jgi:hypothetical protein
MRPGRIWMELAIVAVPQQMGRIPHFIRHLAPLHEDGQSAVIAHFQRVGIGFVFFEFMGYITCPHAVKKSADRAQTVVPAEDVVIRITGGLDLFVEDRRVPRF